MFKGSPRSYPVQTKHYVIDETTGFLSPEVIALGKYVTIKKRGTCPSEQLTFTSISEIEMLHYLLGMVLDDVRKE
jgi:hypothetical protein